MAMDKDEISDLIQNIIKETPEGYKADMAEFIATQAVIFGSYNVYEAVGILEVAKTEYFRVAKEIMLEEAMEEAALTSDCGCEECNCNKEQLGFCELDKTVN